MLHITFPREKNLRISQHAQFGPYPFIPAIHSTSRSGVAKMDNYITAIHFVQIKLHILSAIKLCTSEETTTLLEIVPVYIKIDNFPLH